MQPLAPDPRGERRPEAVAPGDAPVRRRPVRERPPERIALGRVLARTGVVFGRNLLPFLAFGLLIHVPLRVALAGSGLAVAPDVLFGWGWVLRVVADFVVAVLLQCVVAYGVYAYLDGRRGGAWSGWRGLRRFPSVLVVAAALAFMIWGSLIALGAVGLFFAMGAGGGSGSVAFALVFVFAGFVVVARIYSTFFVSAQVAIVETPDPFKAMARSAHLTKGSRWVVFAVLLLVYGLRLVSPLLGASLHLHRAVHAELGMGVALILVAVFDLLLAILLAVAAAVSYAELRRARESTPVSELLEVFD